MPSEKFTESNCFHPNRKFSESKGLKTFLQSPKTFLIHQTIFPIKKCFANQKVQEANQQFPESNDCENLSHSN